MFNPIKVVAESLLSAIRSRIPAQVHRTSKAARICVGHYYVALDEGTDGGSTVCFGHAAKWNPLLQLEVRDDWIEAKIDCGLSHFRDSVLLTTGGRRPDLFAVFGKAARIEFLGLELLYVSGKEQDRMCTAWRATKGVGPLAAAN